MHEKQDYTKGVYSQGACNASGVVFSLEEMLPRLEAMTEEQRRKSPVLRLVAEQLNYLAGNPGDGIPTDKDVLTVIREMVANMRTLCDAKLGTDDRNRHETHKPLAGGLFHLLAGVDWKEAAEICERESGKEII
jgi:hypothetical protein